jgi:hypothetical protein
MLARTRDFSNKPELNVLGGMQRLPGVLGTRTDRWTMDESQFLCDGQQYATSLGVYLILSLLFADLLSSEGDSYAESKPLVQEE